jgi:hypothetical protein
MAELLPFETILGIRMSITSGLKCWGTFGDCLEAHLLLMLCCRQLPGCVPPSLTIPVGPTSSRQVSARENSTIRSAFRVAM